MQFSKLRYNFSMHATHCSFWPKFSTTIVGCFTAAIVSFSAIFFPKFNVMYISCFVIVETLFSHKVKDLLLINCDQDWKKFRKIVEFLGILKNSLKHLEKVIYSRNYLEISRTFFLTSSF